MKKTTFLTAVSALCLSASHSMAALGSISAAASPAGPFVVGNTFTVTLSISGYTEATQIDGYQFKITYPSALFSYAGSIDFTGIPGSQWLGLATQESAAAGYSPSSTFTDTSTAGLILIDYYDAGFSVVEGGTTAASGFLVSFLMQADAPGTGSFTPAAPAGGVTFFDVDLLGAGSPSFSGVSVTVVPEPGSALLFGTLAVAAARRRKR